MGLGRQIDTTAAERCCGVAHGLKVYMACGPDIIPGWLNTDVNPDRVPPPDMIVDMRESLPWETKSVQAITESHGLMFLTSEQVRAWVFECARVLQPNGILRVTEDVWVLHPKIYTDEWKTWRPIFLTMALWMIEAELAPETLEPTQTRFSDARIMVNLHGGTPRAWFMEGKKSCG